MDRINKEFGGSTLYKGSGFWNDTEESIYILDIAYHPTWDNDAKLYDIANEYRREADQMSVYLRYGNGHVQFVEEKSCMDNGESEPFDWNKLREDLHEPVEEEGEIVAHAEHVEI